MCQGFGSTKHDEISEIDRRSLEDGPQGPTCLAGTQLPWYLGLQASDLAALKDSSLSFF